MTRKTALLLAAATAGVLSAVPAMSVPTGAPNEYDGRAAGQGQSGVMLADNERSERGERREHHRPWWLSLLHLGHDDDDDDHGARDGQPNPARAGTVAPPPNGLIGNGIPPSAKVK